MREIKFRAWDKTDKKYIFWEEFQEYFIASGDWVGDEFFNDDQFFIIEQYTGLKDKNGKEIYEGDIVKLKDSYIPEEGIFSISIIIGHWGCETSWDHISGYECSTHIIGDEDENNILRNAERIGNIHEARS